MFTREQTSQQTKTRRGNTLKQKQTDFENPGDLVLLFFSATALLQVGKHTALVCHTAPLFRFESSWWFQLKLFHPQGLQRFDGNFVKTGRPSFAIMHAAKPICLDIQHTWDVV